MRHITPLVPLEVQIAGFRKLTETPTAYLEVSQFTCCCITSGNGPFAKLSSGNRWAIREAYQAYSLECGHPVWWDVPEHPNDHHGNRILRQGRFNALRYYLNHLELHHGF